MTHSRDTSDRWALRAHAILDRVAQCSNGQPHHIAWALAYLGDAGGSAKIPRDLMTGTQKVAA